MPLSQIKNQLLFLLFLFTACRQPNPPKGMALIPDSPDTKAFYLDSTEVTNAQFARFVNATKYVTTAERTPHWDELKKQLPPGTPKPHDSLLTASSLVFRPTVKPVPLNDPGQWWQWKKRADWKHPQGPGSDLTGKENHPVVHISWDDASAYAKWAGKRLPTEKEWETAARGGLKSALYPWGNQDPNEGKPRANIWDGNFPYENRNRDGFVRSSPVKSFEPNGFGLYDMAGNVWEWCADDGEKPGEKAIKGGSFLCNPSYCSGYQIDSKMASARDTGLENTGFRCARDF